VPGTVEAEDERMKKKGLQIDMMAIYRIRIQGALGEDWSAHSYGLDISTAAADDDELPVTLLTGQLPDQDALQQILNALYNQRLPLLSLEYLEDDETESWHELNNQDFLSRTT
jgi:hypothetical protein